jgi:hypothetical protein
LYLPLRALARAILIMSRPGQKSTTANRRVRGLLRALACVLCSALPLMVTAAGRPVRVYEVDVDGKSPAALQEALRQVLVRATGRRDAAEDPALAPLVNDAPKYVQSYATGPRGEQQVVFDGAVLEQALGAAGRSLWDKTRPFTLVALAPPRNRAAMDAARAELERAASDRGLPVSLVPLPLDDASGTPLAADALLTAAERYGADELLVGRGDGSAADSELQWTLYTRGTSSSWSGLLATAIDHTVDYLVPQQGAATSQAEAVVRVQIEGVTTLADYAATQRLLQSAPGVRRANISAADASSVSYEVAVRGGAAGLEQGLTGAARLVRVSGAALVYRYQPQG